MSLVKKFGFGSEAIKVFWKETRNGVMRVSGGRYQYVRGTGMALCIEKNKDKQYPDFISIDEAEDFGLAIDWELNEKVLQEEIEANMKIKEKIEELSGKGGGIKQAVSLLEMTYEEQDAKKQDPEFLKSKEEFEKEKAAFEKEKAEFEAWKKSQEEVNETKETPAKEPAAKSKKQAASK